MTLKSLNQTQQHLPQRLSPQYVTINLIDLANQTATASVFQEIHTKRTQMALRVEIGSKTTFQLCVSRSDYVCVCVLACVCPCLRVCAFLGCFFRKSFFDPFRLNGWKAVDLLSDRIKKRKNARKSTEDALEKLVKTVEIVETVETV